MAIIIVLKNSSPGSGEEKWEFIYKKEATNRDF